MYNYGLPANKPFEIESFGNFYVREMLKITAIGLVLSYYWK